MSGRRALLANIGHHDLQLRQGVEAWGLGPGSIPADRMAEVGALLGSVGPAQAQELVTTLDLPILRRYVEYAQDEHLRFEDVVLFGSSQDDTAQAAKDTYPIACALQRWATALGLEAARIVAVPVKANPSDLGQMLAFYETELERVARRLAGRAEQVDVYVGLTGGTPQMNTALLLQGLEAFGPPCRLQALYVPLGQGARRVTALYRLRRKMNYHSLRALAQTGEYSALIESLGETEEGLQASLVQLARYGRSRLNSDWVEARRMLERAAEHLYRPETLPRHAQLERWLGDLQGLREPTASVWLREQAWQAEAVLRQGNLWAFLVRVASFRENALEVLARRLGAELTDNGRYLSPEWLRAMPALGAFAAQRDVDLKRELNHLILETVTEFLAHQAGGLPCQQLAALKALGLLVRLRNDAAHKGRPVTVADCEQRFAQGVENHPGSRSYFHQGVPGLDALVGGITRLATELSDNMERSNPFFELNETLVELLVRWRRE
jgi:hypothetical protein